MCNKSDTELISSLSQGLFSSFCTKRLESENKKNMKNRLWSAVNRCPSWPCWPADQTLSRCSSTASQSATALESLHHKNAAKTKSKESVGTASLSFKLLNM